MSLAEIDRVEQAIEAASTPAEAREIVDAAEAYRRWTTSAEEQNRAAAVKLKAAAKGGHLLAEAPKRKRPGGSKSADSLSALLGVESDAQAQAISSRWQKIARLADDGHLEAFLDESDDISEAGLLRFASNVGPSNNTGQPEWYTSEQIIRRARAALGTIDLDPASSEIANKTVKAARYFTAADDGLAHDWRGRVWLNPPYNARLVDRFADKLLTEIAAHRCQAAIILTNNSTDTGWWQGLAATADKVCFPAGRNWFHGPKGERSAPLQGQALCYFGPSPGKFQVNFADIGAVL